MLNILVCDDESHITRAVSMKLLKAGYDVVTAPDGQAGFEIARATQPDLIITDYQMPRMDGLQMCKALRAEPKTCGIPIILLTAKGFELDEAQLVAEYGIHSLVMKPFSPRELLKTVHGLLGATVAED